MTENVPRPPPRTEPGNYIDYGATLRAVDAAVVLIERGFCAPGCATGDHGECNTADCTCDWDSCRAYRAEWYA